MYERSDGALKKLTETYNNTIIHVYIIMIYFFNLQKL